MTALMFGGMSGVRDDYKTDLRSASRYLTMGLNRYHYCIAGEFLLNRALSIGLFPLLLWLFLLG